MFTIKTNRLILHDLIETDFDAMHTLRPNHEVTRHIEYIKSETEAETCAWIAGTMAHDVHTPREFYRRVRRGRKERAEFFIFLSDLSDLGGEKRGSLGSVRFLANIKDKHG